MDSNKVIMSTIRVALIGLFALFIPVQSYAITPLFDGGFETGTLQGWRPDNGALVVARGTCFAEGDTTQLSARGQYAGLLRSVSESASSFTSKAFAAARGVTFLALTELRGKKKNFNPFAITVDILDGASTVLSTQPLATAMIRLNKGCPSSKRDQSFSAHFINTRRYQGKQIKIRFSQHKDVAKTGAFTLIDDVGVVNNLVPIYLSYPNARAGVTFNDNVLSLTAGLPFGDLDQTTRWQYSWFINDESSKRPYFNPCINDLEPGEHTANLYIYDPDNNSLVTDTLNFLVPDAVDSSTTSTTSTTEEDTDSNTATSSIASTVNSISNSTSCNARHPTDLAVIAPVTDDDPDEPDDPTDNPSGEPVATVLPTITLTANSPVNANTASDLFTGITLTSNTNNQLSQAVLTLTNPIGDDAILIAASDLQSLNANCSTTTVSCTLSGVATVAIYQQVLDAVQVQLANNLTDRIFNLVVTDTDNQTSASGTSTIGVTITNTVPIVNIVLKEGAQAQ